MVGDIKVLNGVYYFQANSQGTLVKLPPTSWWRKLWLQLRDGLKKWDQVEAVEFARKSSFKSHNKE